MEWVVSPKCAGFSCHPFPTGASCLPQSFTFCHEDGSHAFGDLSLFLFQSLQVPISGQNKLGDGLPLELIAILKGTLKSMGILGFFRYAFRQSEASMAEKPD